MARNPYQVLGINEGATAEEIKSAYRKKAKEVHPDLHPDDPNAQEKMNEVNAAYDMLSNPEKYSAWQSRDSYQQSSPYGSYENPYGRQNFYADDFWQQMFNEFYRQQQAQYQQQAQQGPRIYYRRANFSPLRLVLRFVGVILVLRVLRIVFYALFYAPYMVFHK